MRAIWKGSISFGLVNIPVALYPAARRDELKFRLLRKSDLSPVNYKRVAESDGKEVPWDQIVKGYEYEKGKFVVLKEEDFRRVDVEATQTVDIIDFVKLDEINPLYYSKPYYLEPGKGGAKAYNLLRQALGETEKVGIAKVVIKTRQYLAALKPNRDCLALELMHFQDELIDPKTLDLPKQGAPSKQEMAMARELISKMTVAWDPARYTDDYRSALLEVIKERVKTGELTAAKGAKPKGKPATNVIDLADVLRESLAASSKKPAKRAHAKTPRKKAA